jgi:hypothetical protein
MGIQQLSWIILAVAGFGPIGHGWAYEGGPAGGAFSNPCGKVRFSEFAPLQYSQDKNNTEVTPESAFSFIASKETFPDSIRVTIGEDPVPIAVTPHYAGYHVTGNLPGNVKGTFVRITIAAQGPYQCERGDGWLLKVAGTEAVESARAE